MAEGKHLLVDKTIDHPGIAKKKGSVRLHYEKYMLAWNEGAHCHTSSFEHVKIGGNYPQYLINKGMPAVIGTTYEKYYRLFQEWDGKQR